MGKNNIFRIIALVVFPVLFIFCFFLLAGFEHGATCWIGFSFIILSTIAYFATPFFLPVSRNTYLFGLTTGALSVIYLAASIFLNLIFLIADFENWKIPLVLELVLITAYMVMVFRLYSANVETAQKENKKQADINQIRTLTAKAKTILNSTVSTETRTMIQRVYDELDTCPLKRNSETDDIDKMIAADLDQLQYAVSMNDMEAVQMVSLRIVQLAKNRKSVV